MKFKLLNERREYIYNIEFKNPIKGKKFFVFRSPYIIPRRTGDKNWVGVADVFGTGDVFFNVYRELSPNDLNEEDYLTMCIECEGYIENSRIYRLWKKLNRCCETGKLVPLTDDEISAFMENESYRYENDSKWGYATDEVKNLIAKIQKRYRKYRDWEIFG